MLKRIIAVLIFGGLVSCGGGHDPYESDNPNGYAYESGPAIPARASFRLGSLERSFVNEHNVSCVSDKERNETVIIFNDTSSGATLSVRMGRVDLSDSYASRSYEVVANPGEDSFIIAVDSDKTNGTFRLQHNPSAYYKPTCQINYTLDDWQMNASFRCL
jgi:hypothetical protein